MRFRRSLVWMGVLLLPACATAPQPESSSVVRQEQPASAATITSQIAGDWEGVLVIPGAKLRLVFHVTEEAAGEWTGTLDSLDQGAMGIPLTSVTVEGNRVQIEVASIGGQLRGEMTADGRQIEGTWQQGGAALALTLTRREP